MPLREPVSVVSIAFFSSSRRWTLGGSLGIIPAALWIDATPPRTRVLFIAQAISPNNSSAAVFTFRSTREESRRCSTPRKAEE